MVYVYLQEGSNLVNGWPQKGAGDLLGEAVIALTLSDLGRQHDDDTGETECVRQCESG